MLVSICTACLKYSLESSINFENGELLKETITDVAPEQLVAIKGYLAHISATKKIIVQGSELNKQEGYNSDPSGSINIIFWGNHTDEVQQGSTYFFNEVSQNKSTSEVLKHAKAGI